MTLCGCVLCDIHDEGGEWFGWAHDRSNWSNPRWRPAMALAHGLVQAPGGSTRTGPWVPWRETFRDDGPYETEPTGGRTGYR